MLSLLRRFAGRHRLWRAETRVIAAVSGGSDSVAMLFLLHQLHRRGELRLDAVAHLNHAIRPDADQDELFCGELADRLSLPFMAGRVDVPALARERRQSLEVAGRSARRDFLEEARSLRQADVVATAHTRNDQAETVLLRVIRGAGGRGLAGISPRRGRVIRPLLATSREELQGYLKALGETWREDSTNADLTNPRNRVRHELLPYLERHFNPSAQISLARLAEVARADEAFLSRAAAASAARILEIEAGRALLDREALQALPETIARRVVLHAIASVGTPTSASVDHVDAVLAVAREERAATEVAGLRVEHSGRSVVLVRRGPQPAAVAAFRADLPIPGEVRWPDAGISVAAEGPFDAKAASQDSPGRAETGDCATSVIVSADELGSGLVVRSRLPGDRLRPAGLDGRKKLQDILVDRKVSRTERDRVPIVTDVRDRIVWVAGHVTGEEFRVTDRTNAVIILKLRRI